MNKRSTELRRLIRTLRSQLAHSLSAHEIVVGARDSPAFVPRLGISTYEIQLALELADRGQYGTCIDCNCTIPLARLRAKAACVRCIHCQARMEASTAA